MKAINVDIDVFAMIWSLREAGEDTENDVLKRLLTDSLRSGESSPVSRRDVPASVSDGRDSQLTGPAVFFESKEGKNSKSAQDSAGFFLEAEMRSLGKIRWVDDVYAALRLIGGRGSLHRIYREVETLRRAGSRSVPKTLEATVRRTLEDFSSDSANFRGDDLFANTGRGEWSIRHAPKL